MGRRSYCALALCLSLAVLPGRTRAAAATWFEITSPNFTVWAEKNDGATRTLVWQMEQMRHLAKTLWPWMKVDLPKPLVILAVADEQSMKALAPGYWEVRGGVRPASVWVSAPQQNYIAIRTDIRERDDVQVNPHASAYFSYGNLIISASFSRAMPMWVSRGLAGVLSNTLVRKDDVIVGAPIPWHLERLQQRRSPLREMFAANRTSLEGRGGNDALRDFDAQSWAFVHFLMFGNQGVNAPKLNAFISRVDKGEAPESAFTSELGNIDQYEHAFVNYVNRSLYTVARAKIDVNLDRDRFPARQMTPLDTALAQAAFHVAMRRPAEARAMLDTALKLDATSAAVSALEAVMLETGGNAEGAKAAYAKAVELGTTDPYALYRFSMLNWRGADTATLERLEGHLARAVETRPAFAGAHAALAEMRAELKRPQATIVPHMQRAVALEPSNPWHRLSAARVLTRLNMADQARKTAEDALTLADEDANARAEAQRILTFLKSRQQ